MSTNENYVRGDETGTWENKSFIPLQSKPGRLTKSEINKCAEPDVIQPREDAEMITYIAVLRLNGNPNWGPNPVQNQGCAMILYVNPEGKAFWRRFEVGTDQWDEIPRYCKAPVSAGSETPDKVTRAMKEALKDHQAYENEKTTPPFSFVFTKSSSCDAVSSILD